MKFCTECGHSLEGVTTAECPNCNTPISKPKPKKSASVRKPLSKKTKITFVSTIVVLVLIFSLYKVGESMTSKAKVIEQFEDAILQGDVHKVARYLYSSDRQLEINEDSVRGFLELAKKDPSYFNDLMNTIKKQADALDNKKKDNTKDKKGKKTANDDIFSIFATDSDLSLKRQGKKWLIYDQYLFEIKPYFINVETNLDKATIFLNEKEVGMIEKAKKRKKMGPFIPGEYKIRGVFQGEYANLERENTVELYDLSKNNVNVNIKFNAEYVKISTNYKDATIFLNKKELGKGDKTYEIGPVPMDGSLVAIAEREFPWGTVQSNEVEIEKSRVILEINPLNDDLKNELMKVVNEFNISTVEALKTHDVSKVAHVNEETRAELVPILEEVQAMGYQFAGNYKKATFDLNSFNIYEKGGSYMVDLNVVQEFESLYKKEGEEDLRVETEPEKRTYTIQYKEGKWTIIDINTPWYMNLSKKTMVFDFN